MIQPGETARPHAIARLRCVLVLDAANDLSIVVDGKRVDMTPCRADPVLVLAQACEQA